MAVVVASVAAAAASIAYTSGHDMWKGGTRRVEI